MKLSTALFVLLTLVNSNVDLFVSSLLSRKSKRCRGYLGCSCFHASGSVLWLHGWTNCKMEEEVVVDGTRVGLASRFSRLHSFPVLVKSFRRRRGWPRTLHLTKISFGVAPASVAFAIGVRSCADHLLLTFFVLCGLTRLARFNVTASVLPKDKTGKSKYFEGTPIPTTLGITFLMTYWVYQGWILEGLPLGTVAEGTAFEFHPAVFIFVIHGCLMVSKTIHIPKPWRDGIEVDGRRTGRCLDVRYSQMRTWERK